MNASNPVSILIFALPGILHLIAGIAVLLLTCRWRSSPSRTAFIIFVAISMIAMPLVSVSLGTYLQFSIGNGNYEFVSTLSMAIRIVTLVMEFASAVTLIAFAALHRRETFSAESAAALSGRPVRVWNVKPTSLEKISIMRKREWAFLIDVAPPILLTAVNFMLLANEGYRSSPWVHVGTGLVMLVVLLWIPYIVFKDSIQGASVGKRITGCRVVSRDSGRPIDVGESVLRNVFFVLPLMWIVELIVALVRKDRHRLGDLAARTTVVQGDPQSIDGDELVTATIADAVEPVAEPHPLDD